MFLFTKSQFKVSRLLPFPSPIRHLPRLQIEGYFPDMGDTGERIYLGLDKILKGKRHHFKHGGNDSGLVQCQASTGMVRATIMAMILLHSWKQSITVILLLRTCKLFRMLKIIGIKYEEQWVFYNLYRSLTAVAKMMDMKRRNNQEGSKIVLHSVTYAI